MPPSAPCPCRWAWGVPCSGSSLGTVLAGGLGAAPVYTRGCDGEQDLTGALFLAFAAMHSRDLDKEDLHVIITCE